MRESCLVYGYSGIQSLFEVILLYTFYTVPEQPEDVLSTVRDRLLIIDWGGGVEGFWLCKINDIPRY